MNGLAMAISLVATLVFWIPFFIHFGPGIRKRMERDVTEAKQRGDVATARLLRYRVAYGDPHANAGTDAYDDHFHCVYEYEVDGRTYHYKALFGASRDLHGNPPPQTLELCYKHGKPKKAFDANSRNPGCLLMAVMLAPLPCMAILYHLLSTVL